MRIKNLGCITRRFSATDGAVVIVLNCLSVDSGGQYLDGTTTDVTRTMHYGSPSAEMIEMYTRYGMAHIYGQTT